MVMPEVYRLKGNEDLESIRNEECKRKVMSTKTCACSGGAYRMGERELYTFSCRVDESTTRSILNGSYKDSAVYGLKAA